MTASPRLTARIAGLFYLLMFLPGGVAISARAKLIVNGNAAATAANIVAHEALFRGAFAGDVLVVAFYLVVIALFYELFKPVNGSVSLLAACFGLAACTIQAVACVFQYAPSYVLGSAPYLSAFKPDQLQAMAYLFLKLYSGTYGIALVFFGFYGVLIGYLVFKSSFMPRTLGVLMAIAGASWLVFLSPPLGTRLFPYLLATGIGELLLMGWLLVFGVNAERWKERAGAS